MKTQTRTWQILMVMKVLAWVAFFGFLVEAGAILFSYGVSLYNPDGARNMYKGMNLYNLMKFNFWHYTLSVSFMISLSLFKSFVSVLVIGALSSINMANPFRIGVARRLEKISYVLFGFWLIGMLSNAHTGWLLNLTGEVYGNWFDGGIIFVTGLLYVFSQIFKRGVEIQSENDLTV